MKNKFISEIVISIILLVLLVVLINPSHWLMSGGVQMMVAAIALVIFGIYSTFILREKVLDEREQANRSLAGRVAFLSGGVVILIGIIVEILQHQLDSWLIVALVIMILAKIVTIFYSESHL